VIARVKHTSLLPQLVSCGLKRLCDTGHIKMLQLSNSCGVLQSKPYLSEI
jgi:hypothetical protein